MRELHAKGEGEDNRWRGGGARHRGMACNLRVVVVVGMIITAAGDDHGTLFYFCENIRNFVLPRRTTDAQVRESMNDNLSRADGARVLADLHALRAIGTYKTGVHKPTFSEPHLRLPAVAGAAPSRGRPHGRDRRHRQHPRHQHEARAEAVGGVASGKPEPRGLARWTARRGLCARSRPRHQSRSEYKRRGRSCVLVRRGRAFRALPRQPVLCRRRHRSRYRRGKRPQQRQEHA